MSRFYEMHMEVSGYDPAKTAEIQAAAEEQWSFDNWWFGGDKEQVAPDMHASGQGSLGGGESEEQFTERLSLAIWRANGGYCDVVVDATYLEDLPYETHALDENDYLRLTQGDQHAGDTQ